MSFAPDHGFPISFARFQASDTTTLRTEVRFMYLIWGSLKVRGSQIGILDRLRINNVKDELMSNRVCKLVSHGEREPGNTSNGRPSL